MAIFSKRTDDDEKQKTEKAEQDQAVAKQEGSKLIVGPNIRLTGSEIADCDTVIVEGRVEATVDGRTMQITETGMFTGTVQIDIAEVRGNFQGEITARGRLTVCGTGKVSGKIRYGTLVVEEGGELSGDIEALKPPAAKASVPNKAVGSPPLAPPVEPLSPTHH